MVPRNLVSLVSTRKHIDWKTWPILAPNQFSEIYFKIISFCEICDQNEKIFHASILLFY